MLHPVNGASSGAIEAYNNLSLIKQIWNLFSIICGNLLFDDFKIRAEIEPIPYPASMRD